MTSSRAVTMVFTGPVGPGPGALPSSAGPGLAPETQLAIVRHLIDSSGGTEVGQPAGGVLSVFTDPASAVACAVGTLRALGERGGDAQVPGVGIASGEGVRAGAGSGGAGPEAERLCGLAGRGRIVAAATVAVGERPWPTAPFAVPGDPSVDDLLEVLWREPSERTSGAGEGGTVLASGPPEPDAPIAFSVLGALEVVRDGTALEVTGAKRRALLLRLLLADNRPVTLGRLIEDLWEGSDAPASPSTLRSHLSLLRQIVGADRLRSQHGSVTLTVHTGELDAAAFRSACDDGRRALGAGDAAGAERSFAAALGRWRGSALVDAEGASWALPEASRLDEERLAAIEGLLEARLRLGEAAAVVADAEATIGEHPLRERLWELLMTALYRGGRQADALRAFQRLREHLRDELGLEPSPETCALERAILLHDPSLDGPPFGGAGTEPETAGPPGGGSDLTWLAGEDAPTFIGREAELAACGRARRRAVRGRPVLVLVTGEPGIGKTRLAGEVAAAAAAAGELVLYGRWHEEALAPFEGFRAALATFLADQAGRACLDRLGPSAGPIVEIVPEARGWLGSTVEERPATSEAERYASFEAVVSLVLEAARTRPVVLVLEDVQWADRASTDLLEHLVRTAVDTPLLVLATCRDTGADDTRWLTDGLVGLQREAEVERVDLGGLSASTSLALLRTAIGEQSTAFEIDEGSVREYTGGNPFFIQEMAYDLRSRDTVGSGALPEVTPDRSITERLRDLVHWRLAKLSASCVELLGVASIMGLEFDTAVVGAIALGDESAAVGLVEEACAAGVVAEVGDRPGCYRFTHDVVRQALYSDLGAGRRTRLHLRAARLLEERFGDDRTHAAALALHYRQSLPVGPADRAVHFLQLAGRESLRTIAYETAADHFEQALAVHVAHVSGELEERCDLLLALADALGRSGRLADADQRFAEAFELARTLGRSDRMATAALGYGGVLPAGVEPDPTAHRLLTEALFELPVGVSAARALALGRLAQWDHFSQSRAVRRRLADLSVELGTGLGEPRTLASCLDHRYWALVGPDEVDGQLDAARRIQSIGRAEGDDEVVVRGLRCELNAQLELGEFDAACASAAAIRSIADRIRQPEYLRLGFTWDSLVAGARGEFDEAEACAEEALAIFRQGGHRQVRQLAVGLSLTLLWLRGRMDEFARILEAGRTGRGSLAELALAAWAACETGDTDTARSTLADLRFDTVAVEDRNYHWWYVVAGLSQTACALGDVSWAAFLYGLVEPFADHNARVGLSTYLGAASYYLGILAGTAGRPDAAREHLAHALTRHEVMRAVPFVARTSAALEQVG